MLVCAVHFGVVSAILAAVLSFFAYNFFFIEPIHTLPSPARMSFWRSRSFLLVAIVTGGLAGRVREQSDAARRRIRQTQTLFDFSRKLRARRLDDVLWAVASQTARRSKARASCFLREWR